MAMTFDKSAARVQAASSLVPGGVNSNFRAGISPTPLVVQKAEGAHLVDADGNRLIDYYLGMGAMARRSPTTRRFRGRGLQRGRDAAGPRRRCGRVPSGRPGRAVRAGVELVGDERARDASGEVEVGAASDEDWDSEYHGLKMAVAVVDSLEEAIDHVNRHGSGHSEAIVTASEAAAGPSRRASTPPASTSTPRPASPTASSSGWGPRSATRPRSCMRAGRSACAS